MFGNHGLCGLPEEGAHEKSPKCLDGNLGDLGEFCKGLFRFIPKYTITIPPKCLPASGGRSIYEYRTNPSEP
ncbi:hypothetical protein CYK00_03195 [Neisseria sicca]|uniref:Uncharacterized protein n=1 Tax=Neisseria sicca TaxID=490 RepID=A0A2I1XD90_NEISI|nr:hypothetical protein CYK00_03195 [Neisseria sicca]